MTFGALFIFVGRVSGETGFDGDRYVCLDNDDLVKRLAVLIVNDCRRIGARDRTRLWDTIKKEVQPPLLFFGRASRNDQRREEERQRGQQPAEAGKALQKRSGFAVVGVGTHVTGTARSSLGLRFFDKPEHVYFVRAD